MYILYYIVKRPVICLEIDADLMQKKKCTESVYSYVGKIVFWSIYHLDDCMIGLFISVNNSRFLAYPKRLGEKIDF